MLQNTKTNQTGIDHMTTIFHWLVKQQDHNLRIKIP